MANYFNVTRCTLCVFLLTTVMGKTLAGEESTPSKVAADKPNIILVYLDDAGYGDLGFTGSSSPTPNIDKLAHEGAKLNNFYTAQAACSASRAALLSGQYPNRFSFPWVLYPGTKIGLPKENITLPEYLQTKGYYTAMFGKWHLGDSAGASPTSQGFDKFIGIPYSGDMAPYNPNIKRKLPALPLLNGLGVVVPDAQPSDQKLFTRQFTDGAIDIIEQKKQQPFFIYLAYNQPHVMLYASDDFEGKSKKGLYRDVITEIDFSIGRIVKSLHQRNLTENTLIIFSSDNGPWKLYGNHAGSTGPFREEKGTSFEGGSHMFGLINWPKRIAKSTIVDEPMMTIDIYKTLSTLLGESSANVTLDGRDIMPFLTGKKITSQQEHPYYFYKEQSLEALRYGEWKFYFPHQYRHVETAGKDGDKGKYKLIQSDFSLYNIKMDPGETRNVIDNNRDLVKKLKDLGSNHLTEVAKSRKPTGIYK